MLRKRLYDKTEVAQQNSEEIHPGQAQLYEGGDAPKNELAARRKDEAPGCKMDPEIPKHEDQRIKNVALNKATRRYRPGIRHILQGLIDTLLPLSERDLKAHPKRGYKACARNGRVHKFKRREPEAVIEALSFFGEDLAQQSFAGKADRGFDVEGLMHPEVQSVDCAEDKRECGEFECCYGEMLDCAPDALHEEPDYLCQCDEPREAVGFIFIPNFFLADSGVGDVAFGDEAVELVCGYGEREVVRTVEDHTAHVDEEGVAHAPRGCLHYVQILFCSCHFGLR